VEVIPAVDVLGGRVVRLQEGDFERSHRYGDDPVVAAERWVEEGAGLVHVVDLNGARTGRPNPVLWNRLAGAGIPFQIGGGIRTVASAHAAVTAGTQRVVLGTASVWNPALLREIIDVLGPDRVVAAVDVRAGRAFGEAWLDEGEESGPEPYPHFTSEDLGEEHLHAVNEVGHRDLTVDEESFDLVKGMFV